MLSLGSWLFTILFLYLLCKISQHGDFYFLFLGDELDIFPYELNYINKLFGKGGKEYYLQERRQGGPHSEYKSKDAQNTLLQTLESATPPKKKKKRL